MNQPAAALETGFETRIYESFERQQVMRLLNARLTHVAAGEARIEFPFSETLTQQNGYIHAGILTTAVDSACGYAAFTLMPPGKGVLSIEFKVNFLSPALGEKFIASARVLKAGQTITVCSGEVYAVADGTEKLIAAMQATMMTVEKRNG